jgi:ABC-type multidrug transport system ATPase subunit
MPYLGPNPLNSYILHATPALTQTQGISFVVRRGEVFGLLGVNGAGKTTTFGMLTAEHAPSSGDALIASRSVVYDSEGVRRHMG